jgi:hypothetical protein
MCEIGIWKMNAGLERKRNAVGSSIWWRSKQRFMMQCTTSHNY